MLKIARWPKYRCLANPVTDAEDEKAYPANALFGARRDEPDFGYRFLVDKAHAAGAGMSERIARWICADNGLLVGLWKEVWQDQEGRPAGP